MPSLINPTLLINGKPKTFTQAELDKITEKEVLSFIVPENAVHWAFGEKVTDPKVLRPNKLNTIPTSYSIWGDAELIQTGEITPDKEGVVRKPRKEIVKVEIYETEQPLYGSDKLTKLPAYIEIGEKGIYQIATQNYSECWFLLNSPNLEGGVNFNPMTTKAQFRLYDAKDRLAKFANTAKDKAKFIMRVMDLKEDKLRALGVQMELNQVGGLTMSDIRPIEDLRNDIIRIAELMPGKVMSVLGSQDTNWQDARLKAIDAGVIVEDLAKMTVWHIQANTGAKVKLYGIKQGETNESAWIRWCTTDANYDKRTLVCNQALNAATAAN